MKTLENPRLMKKCTWLSSTHHRLRPFHIPFGNVHPKHPEMYTISKIGFIKHAIDVESEKYKDGQIKSYKKPAAFNFILFDGSQQHIENSNIDIECQGIYSYARISAHVDSFHVIDWVVIVPPSTITSFVYTFEFGPYSKKITETVIPTAPLPIVVPNKYLVLKIKDITEIDITIKD